MFILFLHYVYNAIIYLSTGLNLIEQRRQREIFS